MGLKIHQMDVKTTLFNGMIEEYVYIEQLEGFETSTESCMGADSSERCMD